MSISLNFLEVVYNEFLLVLLTVILIVGTIICGYFRRKIFQKYELIISPTDKSRAQWAILLPNCLAPKLSFKNQEWYISLRRIQKYQWATTLPALLYYLLIWFVGANVEL